MDASIARIAYKFVQVCKYENVKKPFILYLSFMSYLDSINMLVCTYDMIVLYPLLSYKKIVILDQNISHEIDMYS